MSTPSGKPLNYAPKEEREQPAKDPPAPPVENNVDEYLRRLSSSSGREEAHKRLPRAEPLRPVTGLPPVEESACAEKAPRSDGTFIDGVRVPSFMVERLRPPPPMLQHRNNLIAPLLVIGPAVAVLIAYYFSVGSLLPESEPGRGLKLAALDSRNIAPPLAGVAQRELRPTETQDSSAAARIPDGETSSKTAIAPQAKIPQTAELSQSTASQSTLSTHSEASRSGSPAQEPATPRNEASPQGKTTAMLSPDPSGDQAPPANKAVRALGADEIKLLMKQGEQFTATGDLAAARLVFQRAAEAGDATAALAMGATYDPIVVAKLGVLGMSADLGKARSWYERAKGLGSPEASRRLELLANR